jgi:lysophosphatidylcholine acyltransferase/lyso-PAF acetyltransferase
LILYGVVSNFYTEGTVTNGDCLITYKKGAFIGGVPIQPAVIKTPFKHFDPSWVVGGPGPSLGFLVIRTMCQFVNHLEVEYLDLITPTEEDKKDPMSYAERTRQVSLIKRRLYRR